tara:strand:- start:628 stop:1113 length:486 start_codon:yes stop_codon:yes gene_type:complete
MAGFHTKTFIQHDDYMTPLLAWENIKEYIPNDKVIWEAFYGDGKSGEYLTNLGFDVIHDKDDFFESDKGEIVVSNPPFTKKKEVLERLKLLDKPFILLMPQNTLNNNYIRELYNGKIQIIIPRRRIQFLKNGEDGHPKKCNFDCFYYCYKLDLDNDIVFLN